MPDKHLLDFEEFFLFHVYAENPQNKLGGKVWDLVAEDKGLKGPYEVAFFLEVLKDGKYLRE